MVRDVSLLFPFFLERRKKTKVKTSQQGKNVQTLVRVVADKAISFFLFFTQMKVSPKVKSETTKLFILPVYDLFQTVIVVLLKAFLTIIIPDYYRYINIYKN